MYAIYLYMLVQIILGSKSDFARGEAALKLLEELGISASVRVASAHRAPDVVKEIVEKSEAKVFIAIAGLAASLPGLVAAYTTKPVIGVPVSGKLNFDAILSMLQMPRGIPVGCVGLDNAENAAMLAAEILALSDEKIAKKVKEYRQKLREQALADMRDV